MGHMDEQGWTTAWTEAICPSLRARRCTPRRPPLPRSSIPSFSRAPSREPRAHCACTPLDGPASPAGYAGCALRCGAPPPSSRGPYWHPTPRSQESTGRVGGSLGRSTCDSHIVDPGTTGRRERLLVRTLKEKL